MRLALGGGGGGVEKLVARARTHKGGSVAALRTAPLADSRARHSRATAAAADLCSHLAHAIGWPKRTLASLRR